MIRVSLKTAAAVALVAGVAFVTSCSTPQPAGTTEGQGQAAASGGAPQYVYDPGWPKPLPNNWKIGGVTGLAVVPGQDTVWAYNRPNDLTNLELEKDSRSNPKHERGPNSG